MLAPPAVVARSLLKSSYFSVLVVVSWLVLRAGILSRAEDLDQIVPARVPTATAHSSQIILVILTELTISSRIKVSADFSLVSSFREYTQCIYSVYIYILTVSLSLSFSQSLVWATNLRAVQRNPGFSDIFPIALGTHS
jgi:hypothetical protein